MAGWRAYPAPMVTIRLYAAARAAAGVDSCDVPAGTLAAVLDGLSAAFPGLASVLPRCSYLLDEVAIHGPHADVVVIEGSTLDVLPPFAGG